MNETKNKRQYYKSTETVEVKDYPYGYKKTSMFFSLEFVPKKGFRSVRQSINPKTGVLNKPKKSTYYPAMVMYKNEDGHIKFLVLDFYDNKGKDRDYTFLANNFDLFTSDEMKSISAYALMMLKVDIQAQCVYCGSKPSDLLPLFDKANKILFRIHKEGLNLWGDISIDWEKVEACKIEGYQPFKVTSHSIDFKH